MPELTFYDFLQRFPDDDACLDHLLAVRYGDRSACPKCRRDTTWHRITRLTAYACQWCGHHVHPMAGTLFERSRTPLRKWFYALHLYSAAKRKVSARELQRQLGVTYKTAWRMAREIRSYLASTGTLHTYLTLTRRGTPACNNGVRDTLPVQAGMQQRASLYLVGQPPRPATRRDELAEHTG